MVTSSKVGQFLNNGGDLLNISTDLNDFINNFEKSTTLDVLENMGGQNVDPQMRSNQRYVGQVIRGLSGQSNRMDSVNGSVRPTQRDVQREAEEGLQLNPVMKARSQKFVNNLESKLITMQQSKRQENIGKARSKMLLFVDGANDMTGLDSSSSTIVLNLSEDEEGGEKSGQGSEEEQKKSRLALSRKRSTTYSEANENVSEKIAANSSEAGSKSQSVQKKGNGRAKKPKLDVRGIGESPSQHSTVANWSEDEIIASAHNNELTTIATDTLDPFNFTTLLSGTNGQEMSSFDEFTDGIQTASTPEKIKGAIGNDSPASAQAQATQKRKRQRPFVTLDEISLEQGASSKPKRGRPAKKSNPNQSPVKTPARRGRPLLTDKQNRSGKQTSVSNSSRQTVKRPLNEDVSDMSGISSNGTDESMSNFRRNTLPRIFGEEYDKTKKPPPKRARKQKSSDDWIIPTESDDPVWRILNNSSASEEFTGCEKLPEVEVEDFDVMCSNSLSDRELVQSEEEFERENVSTYSCISRNPDPLLSSTQTTDEEREDYVNLVDDEDENTSEELDRERNSIEEVRSSDPAETTQEIIQRMRERNLRIAVEHALIKVEECYKPTMSLAEVIEVGFIDLEAKGIITELATVMMSNPRRSVIVKDCSPKGHILLSVVGHTITLKLKKFLEDRQINLGGVHYTRISRLQRKTADALVDTIRKCRIKEEVLEYDSLRGTVVVIPGPTEGIWFVYEMETYMKLYYLLLVVDGIAMDSSPAFWAAFSKKLAAYGVYRDADSCKIKEGFFAQKYQQLKGKTTPLSGLEKLIFYVMAACPHVSPPVLGSSVGVRRQTSSTMSQLSQASRITSRPSVGNQRVPQASVRPIAPSAAAGRDPNIPRSDQADGMSTQALGRTPINSVSSGQSGQMNTWPVPTPQTAAGHGTGESVPPSSWGSMQNYAPAKRSKSDQWAERLLEQSKDNHDLKVTVTSALKTLIASQKKATEQNDDADETLAVQPQEQSNMNVRVIPPGHGTVAQQPVSVQRPESAQQNFFNVRVIPPRNRLDEQQQNNLCAISTKWPAAKQPCADS